MKHYVMMTAAFLGLVLLTPLPSTAQWNGTVRVSQLLAEPQAGQHVWFDGAPAHDCWGSGPDGIHEYLYAVGGWQPTVNEKLMFAILLAAHLSDRHVGHLPGRHAGAARCTSKAMCR